MSLFVVSIPLTTNPSWLSELEQFGFMMASGAGVLAKTLVFDVIFVHDPQI